MSRCGPWRARLTELGGYTEAVNQDVARRIKTATDRSVALQSALREAEGNLERVRKLFAEGLLSQADLEASEAAFESALADYSENETELERLDQQLAEVSRQVFQVDVPDGALVTRESLQQLELEVMRLEQEYGDSRSRSRAISAELEGARRAYERASTANVQIPEGRVVWNIHAAVGSWINQGNTLVTFVDCSDLLLDIAVDDATLELIEPGMEVNVRLFGSFSYRTAWVILVRGSSALGSDVPVLAAEPVNRGSREGHVLARFDQSDLADEPEKSCGIGRTAYAEFEGINLFEMILLPLFR